ncbi:hypothetical protein A2Z33_04125 [Candidatus Gottesmanbacteria bacterium RBG_16_52_11]|uniref:Methyltransferase domain-containing protein n=1 Tax=Candidatus Gottesmanbacteria bacterium RBG_16_52_11 TaxID=1798374 RepID=A0A1F5YVU1_9BACT|nr:MAG: hypothetical protein A2Z33_04125 [Candidatus Gottesmanbacteria bacterium RBG_16_52_11]
MDSYAKNPFTEAVVSFPVKVASAERTDPDNPSVYPVLLEHLAAYRFAVAYVRGKKVLELGCGTGYGAQLIARNARQVTAIDIDRATIETCQAANTRRNLKFLTSPVETFSDGRRYDVVVSFQVIEHLRNPAKLLETAGKHLTKPGVLILSTPNKTTQGYNENPFHFREFTAGELEEFLGKRFRKTVLFGVYGNRTVETYESGRREKIGRIFALDPLRIRRVIPRPVRQVIFNYAAMAVKGSIGQPQPGRGNYIYRVLSRTIGAIDLIAVSDT